METMLDLAFKVVSDKENESHSFDTIFEYVETTLRAYWYDNLSSTNLTYEELRVKKIGELYRLLTVDGRFDRDSEGKWSLSKNYYQN